MTYVPNYSARRVYWATQETIEEWIAASTNSAGDEDIATDGVMVCGAAARGETLLWSTTDLWAARYIGTPFQYSFDRLGHNCGIIGPRAKVVVDAGAFWMSNGQFFFYDGIVRPLACEVSDWVFGNINKAAIGTTFAFANPQFNEVTWHFPFTGSSTPDHYVTYNYAEGHWTYGALARVAGVTLWPGVGTNPVMVDAAGAVYDHETGTATPGSTPFVESGPVQVDDGDNVVHVKTIIPDDKTVGDVSATLSAKFFPDDTSSVAQTVSLSSQTPVRLTGRQFKLRLTQVIENAWRVGIVRLGGVLGGRR